MVGSPRESYLHADLGHLNAWLGKEQLSRLMLCFRKPYFQKLLRCPMYRSGKSVLIATVALLLVASGLLYWLTVTSAAPVEQKARVEFTADGKLKQTEGYRKWVYVGTP